MIEKKNSSLIDNENRQLQLYRKVKFQMANTIHWENMQAIPNYLKYLQSQFDPGSESSASAACRKWNISHDSLYGPDSSGSLSAPSINMRAEAHTARWSKGIAYLVSSILTMFTELTYYVLAATCLSLLSSGVSTQTQQWLHTHSTHQHNSGKDLILTLWREGEETTVYSYKTSKQQGEWRGKLSTMSTRHQLTGVSKRRFRKTSLHEGHLY